ncbi:6-bladed beta-propeller [Puteibacter caeruleilacunae]|nr:6-bladed beta-propeller [Puteibacter caeruleilacunae]
MIKKLTYFLIILLAMACGHQGQQSQQEIAENVETIQFKFDGKNPTYDEVFSKTEIIPLETNEDCLINTINQMEVWDGKFFILDWKQNTLLVFSDQGKYLNKIGSIGKGPGEYIRPRYFFIDKEKKLVNIFDAPMKKLMCFRQTGELIKEIHLDNYLHAVGKTASGYWGFCSNQKNKNVDYEASKYVKFMTFNAKGDVEKYVKGEKCIDQLNYGNNYIPNTADGGVSFVEPYAPHIYMMKDGEISVKYKIDYSGRFPSKSMLKRIEDMDDSLSASERKMKKDLSTKYHSMFQTFFETPEWIQLFTGSKGTTLFYNKKTHRTHEFSTVLAAENSWETYFVSPVCMKDNVVYGQATELFLQYLYRDKDKFTAQRLESLKQVFDNLKAEDNPFIIKYTLKN